MMHLEPLHPNFISGLGLWARLALATKCPKVTHYTCPRLMTLSAIVYAFRGFTVDWLQRQNPKETNAARAVYRIHKNGRHTHGSEIRCYFPVWMIYLEGAIRNVQLNGMWSLRWSWLQWKTRYRPSKVKS